MEKSNEVLKLSLELPEEIEQELESNIRHRKRFIWRGMAVFIVSTLLAI